MATITKQTLSGSINGKAILVAGTTSASATPIHTAVAGTASLDEIWLYATNNTTSSLTCSVLWGGQTEPNDVSRAILNPTAGRTLLVDGRLLQNGLTVYVYGGITNWITVDGFINRII